nr:MAG: N-acetyl-alpha-D-glucosaminyl L-malate synthase BshA [Bacillota bacterium]
MHVGIVCYPSVGGSGIVATELGLQLARRGHEVHFFSSEVPFRLRGFHERVFFHQVETPTYYVFREPPYVLSLASRIVQVHRLVGLDVVHAHYAIPHAAAAFLAREMAGGGFRVVTTLHGTDITLLAQEPSYAEVLAFCIDRSDAVTAVSRALREQTLATLGVQRPLEVIPNFLDCHVYQRQFRPEVRAAFARPEEKIVMHMSNLRPVKRVEDVVRVFAAVARQVPAQLLVVGDGPEAPRALEMARALGVLHRVHFLGSQEDVVSLLSVADLFLLPSETESFGLAALEAMACGVPVVATRTGGLPEVVADGETGCLLPVGDVEGMAAAALRILTDPDRHARMAAAGVERARTVFCAEQVVPRYEALYKQICGRRDGAGEP